MRGFLLAVAVLAALCLGGLGSAASSANGLTINVTYTPTAIQAKLSNGTVLTSGTVVPPGPYSVVVYDAGDVSNPQFTMTGPGASISSDLNPTGQGIEVPTTFGPFVLQPSSSYEIADTGITGAVISFTTAATGSSASPDTTTTPKGSSGGAAASSNKLALFVQPGKKPMLTQDGKPVKTLKAGKYSVVVGDLSTKAGLIIGHGKVKPTTLSAAAATGTSTRSLKLTAGKWFIEGSTKGPRTYFTVT
jgi:hypothetical protein